ncbi:TPA: HNH endonuclease [Clostridium perfringens]
MIKLERGLCPRELDEEVKKKLTELYSNDKEKDVWNSPIIKKPLKKALMDMSKNKCAYCECILNIESKDVTIDHFLPKVNNESLVIEWENLLPSCLRCNRKKNRKEDKIINPCDDEPKEYLGVKRTGYRLKEINGSGIGYNTIRVLGLNDIRRVITPRMQVIEKIINKLEEVYGDIKDLEIIMPKYVDRVESYLSEALSDKEYSAIASAKILDDVIFKKIKDLLLSKNLWNFQLKEIELELKKLALPIIEE